MAADRIELHGWNEPEPESPLSVYLSGLRERVHGLYDSDALPRDEHQIKLARRLQTGDAQAARELIRGNRPLIEYVLQDYIGEEAAAEPALRVGAAQSVMKAAGRYDPYRHGSFAEHAAGAIVTDLQETIPFPSEADAPQAPKVGNNALQALWSIAQTKPRIERVQPPIPEAVKPKPPARKPRSRPPRAPKQTVVEATSLTPYRGKRQLSDSQLVRLGERNKRGDKEARERLIHWLLPRVLSPARVYNGYLAEFDDLVQVAALAIVRQVDRYDPRRGHLGVVAQTRIQGAMVDQLRHEETATHGNPRVWSKPKNSAEPAPETTTSPRVSKLAFSLDDENVHFDPEDSSDIENDVIERLTHQSQWAKIARAMSRLQAGHRDALVHMHGFEDEDPAETYLVLGKRLGMTESGALFRYRAAVKALSAEVKRGDAPQKRLHTRDYPMHKPRARVKSRERLAHNLDSLENIELNPEEIETVLHCLPDWHYKTGMHRGKMYSALSRQIDDKHSDIVPQDRTNERFFGVLKDANTQQVVLFVKRELLPQDVIDVVRIEQEIMGDKAEAVQ